MEDQWAGLFVYFDEQIDEARELIKQELTELRNQLCGVYSSKIRVLLFHVAEVSLRSSDFSDFDGDVQFQGARSHVFTTKGNL